VVRCSIDEPWYTAGDAREVVWAFYFEGLDRRNALDAESEEEEGGERDRVVDKGRGRAARTSSEDVGWGEAVMRR
jgi:hypothetical protein